MFMIVLNTPNKEVLKIRFYIAFSKSYELIFCCKKRLYISSGGSYIKIVYYFIEIFYFSIVIFVLVNFFY